MTPKLPPRGPHFVELLRDLEQRSRPGDGLQLAVHLHQRRLQPLGSVGAVERIAALDAEEFAVDAGAVAIVDAQDLVVADAKRRLAAVRAVRADGADVVHLPGARLIAVGALGQRADRTDVDALAALVAFQVVAVTRGDLGNDAAVGDAERADAHAFVAHADAAVAEDAARAVVEDDRGPLLFVDVVLDLR